MKFSFGLRILPILVSAVFFLSAATVLAQSSAQIVEAAKTEKELLVYATTQAPVMIKITHAFNKKYPFIKVEHYRAGAEKIAQRFDTEYAAARFVVDVVNLS